MNKSDCKGILGVSAIILILGLPVVMSAQATSQGEMPQYLFHEFSRCDILMKGGQVNTAVMNYNTVTEKMVFISNEKYYDLTNPGAVDTITLQGRKFVPAGKAFYEVLVIRPISLYIQHKGNLLSAGKQVGYGGTSQTASAKYISNIEISGLQTNLPLPKDFLVNPAPVYWIRMGETWSDFTSEKQFINLFPDNSARIKSFIRENRLKFDRSEHVVRLVEFCSNL